MPLVSYHYDLGMLAVIRTLSVLNQSSICNGSETCDDCKMTVKMGGSCRRFTLEKCYLYMSTKRNEV